MDASEKHILEMLNRDARDTADRLGAFLNRNKNVIPSLVYAHVSLAETAARNASAELRNARNLIP